MTADSLASCLAAPSAREALHSSRSQEWQTPEWMIVLARNVLSGIDLDPASSAEANATVKAIRYFTAEDDGLTKPWIGTVWLNPPYGRNQGAWIQKLLAEWRVGHVAAALVLVNAATETKWFRPLWSFPLCFLHGRIEFVLPGRVRPDSPTNGSVVAYVGREWNWFRAGFSKIGTVCLPDAARDHACIIQRSPE